MIVQLKDLLDMANAMAECYLAMVRMGVPESVAKDMSISAVQTHYALETQAKLADKVADRITRQEKKPWEE
jgi:hypothetical protein